jgi:hypothetical protein
MSTTTPRIWTEAWGDQAYLDGPADERIALDSAAWFAWLEAPTTTSFAYPVCDASCGYIVGVMTVRKERRQRGRDYWSAYRRRGRRLCKVYLGPASAVTRARLDEVARSFLQDDAPPPRGHRAPLEQGQATTDGTGPPPDDGRSLRGQPPLDATSNHPLIMDAAVTAGL